MKILPRFLLLLLPLQPLFADWDADDRRSDRPHGEEPRVILYSGENYSGVSIELAPRAELVELAEVRFSDGRKTDDRISSVRIFGGLRVVLFADPGFFGDKLELSDSVTQLKRIPRGGGNWDNCISSVRVGPRRAREQDRDRDPVRDRGYDGPPRRDFDEDHRQDGGADDRPGHDRVRRPPPDPERMVDRAFRELLQREPTRAEIREYRELIIAQDWGHDRLRDAIRASREFRAREADRIVMRVYRDLLGRDPDKSGWETWRRKILNDNWSEERLRDKIRQSEEYRRRQNQPKSERGH